MITVACVEWGNYCGCGAEYVDKLRSMVRRHLHVPHQFWCIRPNNGHVGWWNKVELFKPGLFTGRVVYFDLDTIIVDTLDELAKRKGILHLDRWGWTEKIYGSGVMVWDAGEHSEIYERFNEDVPKRLRGDQDWITELGGWDALPSGICCSFKYHCKDRVKAPVGASVVCFHGPVKPHTLNADHWLRPHWR